MKIKTNKLGLGLLRLYSANLGKLKQGPRAMVTRCQPSREARQFAWIVAGISGLAQILAMDNLFAQASSGGAAGSSQNRGHLGLSVAANGVLMRNGTPFRGVGANYFDAFLRTLRDRPDTSYREGFKDLAANGIPFVRFAACGFWPADYRLYLQNKEEYFRRLDGVVHAAEESKVGLIPSLFWANFAVPDLMHESRDQWGNPKSKTREFMRRYTREVVSRYADSPAIWSWEFGCEFQLVVDFPDPLVHLPPVAPQLGTPASRGIRDALTFTMFKDTLEDFARVVRGIDPTRILLTGNGLPRPSAYHMATEARYVVDSEAQFERILVRDNPGPFSPICIHASPPAVQKYFADRHVSYAELIQAAVQAAHSAGKPLYLEEFGTVPRGDTTDGRRNLEEILKAIESNAVPLASVWVYDRKLSHDRANLTFANDHAYLLKRISDFNRRWGIGQRSP